MAWSTLITKFFAIMQVLWGCPTVAMASYLLSKGWQDPFSGLGQCFKTYKCKRACSCLCFDALQGCPFCRKVREAASILDIDVKYYPCPAGGPNFRPQVSHLMPSSCAYKQIAYLHPTQFCDLREVRVPGLRVFNIWERSKRLVLTSPWTVEELAARQYW